LSASSLFFFFFLSASSLFFFFFFSLAKRSYISQLSSKILKYMLLGEKGGKAQQSFGK